MIIQQMSNDHSKVYCSASMCFYRFCSFSCWSFLILFHYDLIGTKNQFNFIYILKCAIWPKMYCIFEKVTWATKKNLYSHQHLLLFVFLIANLTGVKWNLSEVLICISFNMKKCQTILHAFISHLHFFFWSFSVQFICLSVYWIICSFAV
jgi:hypothetical protein